MRRLISNDIRLAAATGAAIEHLERFDAEAEAACATEGASQFQNVPPIGQPVALEPLEKTWMSLGEVAATIVKNLARIPRASL